MRTSKPNFWWVFIKPAAESQVSPGRKSVDQALCFGWIDGVRKSLDAERYTIRFTQRKPKSIWSAVNIKKIEALTKAGLMRPAGLAAYALRDESRSRVYSFENEAKVLSKPYEKLFKANKKAWAFLVSAAGLHQAVGLQSNECQEG